MYDKSPTFAPPNIQRTSERLTLFTCDFRASKELEVIIKDPTVCNPYYIESNTMPIDSDESWHTPPDHTFNIAARERITGQIVGCVQFTHHQVSYFVNPLYWNKGYGYEMVRAGCNCITQLAQVSKLEASVSRENIASRRILERIGFGFIGLKHQRWGNDSSVYPILRYRLLL